MAGTTGPDVDGHGHVEGHGHPHVVPVRTYVLVFLALLAGTWLTVAAAGQDFGRFNTVVALAIAVTKATLVVLFFMHVKYSGRLIHVLLAATLGCLALVLTIVSDYYSPRTDGTIPERATITRQ